MRQEKDRRIRRKETNDSEVCTGWMQKWISPNLIRKDEDLYVREIVSGPFSSPKLLTTQPIVEISSCRRQAVNVNNKNHNNLRHGIPDTWKEYLVKKGFCNSMEAFVLQKNLIPFYVKSFATNKIWNELGLPLVQGIPDPWKSKFLPETRSVKCLRQRCVYNDTTSTQITCIYDGDDEAEIEHGVKSQFNEDDVDNKKDPFQEENTVKKTLQSCTNNFARKHDDQLQIDKKSKIASRREKPIRKFGNDVQKETEKIVSNTRAINIRRNKNSSTTRNKAIQTKEKFGNDKPSLQKHKTKTDNTNLKNKIENRLESNGQKYSNVVSCTCTLQNHVFTTVKDFSEHADPLQATDTSNLVLCQNCENLYHNRNLQQLNDTTKTMNACVLDTKSALQCKIVDKKELNKPYPRLERTKERFKEENHVASEQELKLVCGQCNNPYLKIASIFTNTIGQRTCSSNRKKKERQKIRTHVSKCSMTRKQSKNVIRCSKNCCCTCTETKTHASKGDLDQARRRNSCSNNATERGTSGVKFDENVKAETENAIQINFREDIGDEDVTEIREEKIIPKTATTMKLHEKQRSKDDSNKRREYRHKSDTTIVKKPRVKQFQQVRFDPTLKYAISDSGEYADVSDNYTIDSGANVAAQNLSVTSFTFMRQLRNTIPIRKFYRRMKLNKANRFRHRTSQNNFIDFEQISKIDDKLMNDDRKEFACNTLYCSNFNKNNRTNRKVRKVNQLK